MKIQQVKCLTSDRLPAVLSAYIKEGEELRGDSEDHDRSAMKRVATLNIFW